MSFSYTFEYRCLQLISLCFHFSVKDGDFLRSFSFLFYICFPKLNKIYTNTNTSTLNRYCSCPIIGLPSSIEAVINYEKALKNWVFSKVVKPINLTHASLVISLYFNPFPPPLSHSPFPSPFPPPSQCSLEPAEELLSRTLEYYSFFIDLALECCRLGDLGRFVVCFFCFDDVWVDFCVLFYV